MVTCTLIGGLGNRMFQIAAAVSLSIDNGDDYVIDTSKVIAPHDDIDYIDFYDKTIFAKIKKSSINYSDFNFYYEPNFHYNPIIMKNNINLYGYFQSEKYFLENKEKIVEVFINDEYINEIKKNWKNKLNNSLSIHVRRQDYTNSNNSYPVQDMNYFNNAVNIIESNSIVDNIFIFSDDVKWCKENFKENEKIIFIENNNDVYDLYLMSLCSNNIICNSTFSWWGSYLNKNIHKNIIVPKKWFSDHINKNYNDIYTKNMIKL
jgi:hypothetical protein